MMSNRDCTKKKFPEFNCTAEDFSIIMKNKNNATVFGKLTHLPNESSSEYVCELFSETKKARIYVSERNKKFQDLVKKFESITDDTCVCINGKREDYKGCLQLANIKEVEDYKIERNTVLSHEVKCIGVVVSKNSIVKEDFDNILKQYKLDRKIEIIYYDKRGFDSPAEIAKSIENLSKKDVDTICIIRGGTDSKNDENYFNYTEVVRAIINARKKGKYIITGLGHANKFNFSDLFADLTANTPTDAAYKIVMYYKEKEFEKWKKRIIKKIQSFKI